ncbi:hypothetical protein D9613_010018 [Agrocybe pediades]|uniref:GST C-terminal domain-containing protein n=1 Tax=Agrocybe pediades TaxID=84607 RepID=A0A8H4QWJ1_9AGAR|nr:hypothetical protein D9613_010018 [Agrocybe pediades]
MPVVTSRASFDAEFFCPAWATRTLIVRKLKGLENLIPVTVVSPFMGADGWPFAQVSPFPAADEDPLYKSAHVKDLYFKADPDYSGRFTVPVLWDKKLHTIVNNESSEIIRIFNTAFNDFIPADKAEITYYPEALRKEIDELNEWVYHDINNGVYKSGFASTQEAYEKAVHTLFNSLDRVEKLLTGKEYLIGDRLTEADIRLFVTIIRFDPVYVGHFKCNIRTIRNGYPAIHKWMQNLYWNNPAFKDTTNFEHIKAHYYWSHPHFRQFVITSPKKIEKKRVRGEGLHEASNQYVQRVDKMQKERPAVLSHHHITKDPPIRQDRIATPELKATTSQPFGRAERNAAEGLEVCGELPPLVWEAEAPCEAPEEPCEFCEEGEVDVDVTEAEAGPDEVREDAEGVMSGFVDELIEAAIEDEVLLTGEVALGVGEDWTMEVPEIKNPLPMVDCGTQDEEDGAGWAAGVTGWPWKKVEVP